MNILRRTLLVRGVSAAIAGPAAVSMFSPAMLRCDEGPTSTRLIHNDIIKATGSAELSMLYRGNTAEECRAWQKAFRAKLLELLGDSTPPRKWKIEQQSRKQFDDHVRLELLLHAKGTPSLPVYLLVPQGASAKKPVPGVLCIHGHGAFGNEVIVGRTDLEGAAENIARLKYDYGLKFVRQGYAVAAPCMIPFGRRVDREKYRGNDPCAVTFVRMQALGQLPITANLRDLRWSIDLLQSRPEVRRERIGCAGLSYGGRMTMMVSAIDRRIKVASVSGALNLLQERMTLRHSCGSQIIPGLLKFGDYSEIGSLIAPRPCVWEVGSRDGLIVPKWDDIFRNRLKRVYKSLGVPENLHFDNFEGGHQWSGRVAMPLFDTVLKS